MLTHTDQNTTYLENIYHYKKALKCMRAEIFVIISEFEIRECLQIASVSPEVPPSCSLPIRQSQHRIQSRDQTTRRRSSEISHALLS